MGSPRTTVKRPAKVLRINYWSADPIHNAFLGVWGDPAEVKLGVEKDTFLTLNSSGISLSPGLGKQVNIQGMTQNLIYGGLVTDLPFPMSLLPVTPINPFPNQVFRPPLKELLPLLREVATLVTSFASSGGPV